MSQLPYSDSLLYGGFLLFSIFAYTSLMDKKTYGVLASVLQAAFGAGIILLTGDWFGIKSIWPVGTTVLSVYLVVTAVASVFFLLTEFRTKEESEMVISEAR